MKKFISKTLLLLVSLWGISAQAQGVPSTQAQETQDFAPTRIIKGAVLDKNGNPLPGATIRATGGAETATTDADGTYSIEVPFWLKSLTAYYPGLRDQKLNTTDKTVTIFTLKPLYRTYGFVNLMFANVWQVKPSGGFNDKVQQLGLMGGAYRKWGGYAKIMFGLFASNNGNYMYGSRVASTPTVTGGVLKPINQNINVYLGAGVGFNYNFCTKPWDDNKEEYQEEQFALAFEGGVMYKWRKLNAVLGLTYITQSQYWTNQTYRLIYNKGNLALFVGVGLNI